MKSGMLAAEAAFDTISEESKEEEAGDMSKYEENLKKSWVWSDLKEVRNLRPSFNTSLGLWGGIAYSGIDSLFLKGRVPWTFKHPEHSDAEYTQPASKHQPIEYPAYEEGLSGDLLGSVSLTGTNHAEDQPVHLRIRGEAIGGEGQTDVRRKHVHTNVENYAGLLGRACPAAVYEYVEDEGELKAEKSGEGEGWGGKKLIINSQNCIHCKLCDIKVPTQDIDWTIPEGGGGPKYSEWYNPFPMRKTTNYRLLHGDCRSHVNYVVDG